MRIGVDIDGVLADFNTGFVNRIIQVTGKDLLPTRPFVFPCWNWPEHFGYTTEEISRVWDSVKKDRWFWGRLPEYPTTFGDLDMITDARSMGSEVYFVTNRMGVKAKTQTEEWLEAHGYELPTVITAEDKALVARALRLDIYFDDKWENALAVANVGTVESYLIDRPWNTEQFMNHVVTDPKTPIRRIPNVAYRLF